MKYILILFILTFLSCNNSVKKPIIKSEKMAYKQTVCDDCNGSGLANASTTTRVIMGIITLGPGALIEKGSCSKCDGKGVIHVLIVKDTIIYK